MKKLKKQNGITLIALVITIIVMLILVGISISMAVNGGLFGYAGRATVDTKNEIDKEKELAYGKIQIGNKIYNSIDEYLYGKTIEGHDGEKFSGIYTETKEYSDGTDTAVIPKGFAVGTSEGIDKISTGLVIRDENGNEFVWIPVEKAVVTESEINSIIENPGNEISTALEAVQSLVDAGTYPMAVEVTEQDSEGKNVTNYKGILYVFSGTDTLTATVYDWTSTSSYREPANLIYDDQSDLGSDWNEETFQKSYNNMIKSVVENGGFYIGRYEISSGTYILEEEKSTVTYAQSQVGKDVMEDTTWYNLYEYESNYAKYNESLGVTSEMVWDSQWDQMMIFVNGKDDGAENPAPFYVTTSGNRTTGFLNLTGENDVDQVANIFDLEANQSEFTQGANPYTTGVSGGSVCIWRTKRSEGTSLKKPATFRNRWCPGRY